MKHVTCFTEQAQYVNHVYHALIIHTFLVVLTLPVAPYTYTYIGVCACIHVCVVFVHYACNAYTYTYTNTHTLSMQINTHMTQEENNNVHSNTFLTVCFVKFSHHNVVPCTYLKTMYIYM